MNTELFLFHIVIVIFIFGMGALCGVIRGWQIYREFPIMKKQNQTKVKIDKGSPEGSETISFVTFANGEVERLNEIKITDEDLEKPRSDPWDPGKYKLTGLNLIVKDPPKPKPSNIRIIKENSDKSDGKVLQNGK